MKLKKTLMTTAAAAVTLMMGLQSTLTAYAIPLNTKYISEIKTVCAMSADEARTKFKNEGYTMMETDVNPTLGKAVYMGYKTSYDINDALRGLHFMNMKGKYSFSDYEQTLEDHRALVESNLDGIVPAIEKYREAYAEGTQNALHAHEMLNHVYDYVTGEYMGDFLLNCELESGKRGQLTDAFMKGNAGIVAQIQKLLNMAGQKQADSWLERFEANSLDALTQRYESSYLSASLAQQKMSQEYAVDAAVLLNEYWDSVYNAILTVEELYVPTDDGYDASAALNQIMLDANGNQKPEPKTDEEKTTFLETVEVNVAGAMECAGVYDALAMYEYDGNPMLDFFRRPASEVQLEELYPLIDSLSEGERGVCQTVGLGDLILQAGAADQWDSDREDLFRAWSDNSGKVSLYYGVNLKAFDKGVALTSSATERDRTNSFGARWWEVFTDPSRGETNTERFARPLTFLAMSGACLVTGIVSWIVQAVIGKSLEKAAGIAASETQKRISSTLMTLGQDLAETQAARYGNSFLINPITATAVRFSGKTVMGGLGFVYRTFLVISCVFYLIAVISLVLAAMSAILSMWHTATYTQIPVAMCDAWQGGTFTEYILYDAVEGLNQANMEFADMNGYVEKWGDTTGLISEASVGWLVLYATKDERAGAPITELKLTTGSGSTPIGYEGVSIFGEGTVTNLTDGAYTGQSDDPCIRLYCKRASGALSSSVATNGAYTAIGLMGLLGGSSVGALLGLRRQKKRRSEPVSAQN